MINLTCPNCPEDPLSESEGSSWSHGSLKIQRFPIDRGTLIVGMNSKSQKDFRLVQILETSGKR